MNTYIAISAIIMFIALIALTGNILHYVVVWTQRNSPIFYKSVEVTKQLKSITQKIDASIMVSVILFSHQWLIMNFVA